MSGPDFTGHLTDPRWIDASVQPPNNEQTVLACWQGRSAISGMEVLTYHAPDEPGRGGLWAHYDIGIVDEPTHWMPLPNPPPAKGKET